METIDKKAVFSNDKTIYGPVYSWRFGQSLGIDPLFYTSTCSFNCIYCQLGHIQNITIERKEYVSTEKVLSDFNNFLSEDKKIDVITFSGSGEPTLAKNLDQMILGIRKRLPQIPIYILTNGTTLHLNEVVKTLQLLDSVTVKLDAGNEKDFQMINRPHDSVCFSTIVKSLIDFRKVYSKKLEIQCMFMPVNQKELENLASLLLEIAPDVVQMNTPKRPYPLSWHRENRGNHLGLFDHEVRELKKIEKEKGLELIEKMKSLTNLEIISAF